VTLLDCVPREYNACSGHQRWWPLDIPLCTACIRAHDNAVLDVDVLAYPSERRRLGVEVVDRYVEETLNLTGMEIHCDDVVATGGLEHIGHEFRCNGRTRLVLLVLAGVWEVWNHSSNAACRCGLACVDHDQQLHERIVDVAWRGGLQDEYCTVVSSRKLEDTRNKHTIFVSHRLSDSDGCFLVRVLEYKDFCKFYSESVQPLVMLFGWI
jgi:hypothetical protein